MPSTNLISASLTPEQKAEVTKCLSEVQKNLSFLISISQTDKQRLVKMGPQSFGYVDDCIATFTEFKNLLPGNLDVDELRRDRVLYDDLATIAVKVRAISESLQDSMAALGSDIMTACNDGYQVIKRSGLRDNAVKQASQKIGRHHKARGTRTATVKPS